MTANPTPSAAESCDHDWEVISDWAGDPGVINGTYDCSFKRCTICGQEAPLELDDMYDDDPTNYF